MPSFLPLHYLHRTSSGRLDNAFYILSNGTEGTKITTASLNVIMAGCAGCGDAEGAFQTYSEFDKFNVTPNGDTFSFLVEALGTEMTASWADKLSKDDIERNITAAHEVIATAEDHHINSPELLHQYLRTLCAAGHLEETMETLKAAIQRNDRVLMETFSLVAIRHAKAGDYSAASYVVNEMYANAGYGKMSSNVIGRIKNIKNRPRNSHEVDLFHEDV